MDWEKLYIEAWKERNKIISEVSSTCPSDVADKAVPILCFGDITKVNHDSFVTIGINPSYGEHDNYFNGINIRAASDDNERASLGLNEQKNYFQHHLDWFKHVETFLNYLGASYINKNMKYAVHTDVNSHLATKRSWGNCNSEIKDIYLSNSKTCHQTLKYLFELKPTLIVFGTSAWDELKKQLINTGYQILCEKINEHLSGICDLYQESFIEDCLGIKNFSPEGNMRHDFSLMQAKKNDIMIKIYFIRPYNSKPFNDYFSNANYPKHTEPDNRTFYIKSVAKWFLDAENYNN